METTTKLLLEHYSYSELLSRSSYLRGLADNTGDPVFKAARNLIEKALAEARKEPAPKPSAEAHRVCAMIPIPWERRR